MVLSMERTDERRTEQRLQYRWPVRFSTDTDSKPFQGQIVDVSSKGIAFLCHANQSDFDSGQQIKANFGVPRFDSDDSFDTVFFERIGYISRIDKPSSQVHRVALQFATPLFFKPGEQDINEVDIQKRLDAKNLSIIKSEETARVYDEALKQAESQLRLYAQAKAQIEEKLKAEIEDRFKTEIKLKTQAEQTIRSYAADLSRQKENLRTKEKEISKIRAELKNSAKLLAKAKKKSDLLEEQLEKIKAEAASEIARVKAQAADMINEIKLQLKDKTIQAPKKELLKKFDKFISDRNKLF